MSLVKRYAQPPAPSNGRHAAEVESQVKTKATETTGVLIAVSAEEQKCFLGVDTDHPSGTRILGFTRDSDQLSNDLRNLNPQIVLVSSNLENYQHDAIYQIVNWPDAPIAVVGLVPARGTWGAEMVANGALGFYNLPITPAVVEKFLAEAPQFVDEARQRWRKPLIDSGLERTVIEAVKATAYQKGVIVFWSLKGGDGKTTLAVNTACLLSQVAGKKVLLIDGDMNCGRVSHHLGIPAGDKKTLLHLASDYMLADNHLDAKMLRRCLVPVDPFLDKRTKVVESRLDVLFGITRVAQCTAPELRGKQGYQFMNALLELASSLYDFVIVDLGSNTELPPHKAALLASDQVIFVNTSDRTSLLHNLDTLEYLTHDHDVRVDKFKLVINRYHPDDRIDLGEVPKVMKMPIVAVVPEDLSRKMVASVNVGRPFVLDHMGKNEPGVEATLRGLLDIAQEIFPPMNELIKARHGSQSVFRLFGKK
jgi:MinD-like ATPase involved in chromosome partitioning or flagellar assembly